MTSLSRCPALLTPPSLRALKPSCQPFTVRQRRHSHCAHVQRCVSQAKQNDRNIQLPGLLRVANVVTNSAASLVPSSVPRPVAKAGVIGVTSLIALWLFGKVVSTVFTIAAVGGAIFLLVKSQGGGSKEVDLDEGANSDPLASARRIMDKYK